MISKMIMVSILGALAGCGGSSSSTTTTTTTTTPTPSSVQMSGAVVDWYIANSFVFADVNNDGVYQAATEPSTRTDANGYYDLDTSGIDSEAHYYLIAKGGTDKATSQYYGATLMAEGHYKNITPLTTLDTLLIKNHGYSSADADLIVQKLVGMEDREDVTSLDANPATNKYLLSGARMLAMYNNVLTEVMSQVVTFDTTVYSQEDINIKISRDAWDQMAAQVNYEYQQELIKEDGNKNKVEPEITDQSLQYMVKFMVEKYQQQYNLSGVNYLDLMPAALAKAIYDYVDTVTDDDYVLSGHAFGDDEDEDDRYMTNVQTDQDNRVVTLVKEYALDPDSFKSINVDGDDDEDEYGDDDHH